MLLEGIIAVIRVFTLYLIKIIAYSLTIFIRMTKLVPSCTTDATCNWH